MYNNENILLVTRRLKLVSFLNMILLGICNLYCLPNKCLNALIVNTILRGTKRFTTIAPPFLFVHTVENSSDISQRWLVTLDFNMKNLERYVKFVDSYAVDT